MIVADLKDANLQEADLSYANLSYANLSYANLSYANLSYANLSYADLSNANLRNANLQEADLTGANLTGANLADVTIRYTKGNCREIMSLRIFPWNIALTKDIMAIGCQQHSIEQWMNFSDTRIMLMDNKALRWWEQNKPKLVKLIKQLGE